MTVQASYKPEPEKHSRRAWITGLLLILVLLAGAFFRFSGLFWGEYTYLHPDERFLIWVGSDISPVHSLSEYFDTAHSSLNPQNRGHGFYVYGTLPMFLTRYAVQWIFGRSGFEEMTQVGRSLSVVADLLTVFLVYLVARRLYDRRVAVLAAAFSAAVVLQIQQSHFFTMDTFINAFSFLAFYFAVGAMTDEKAWRLQEAHPKKLPVSKQLLKDPLLYPSLLFGLALGMAVASKLNAAPMAIALPAAMLVGLLTVPKERRQQRAEQAFIFLILAAFVSILTFRIFQPYAFRGPGFFGILPNEKWVANIRELRAQSSGDVDFPPAMQWARRPVWFSFQNMVLWGLGLPLGVLAWAGFLWAGWRLLTRWKVDPGEWQRHALLWGWTAIYFTWQSMVRNPTMRYQLPVYPTLVIFAAWAAVELFDWARRLPAFPSQAVSRSTRLFTLFRRLLPYLVFLLIAGVFISTYLYAYAFTGIYTKPITRVAASRWIYQNIPAPINLRIETGSGVTNQPVSFPYDLKIGAGLPYVTSFSPALEGTLAQVDLADVRDESSSHETRTLILKIAPSVEGGAPAAQATLTDDLTSDPGNPGKSYTLSLDHPIHLTRDSNYTLSLEIPGSASPALVIEGALALHFLPGSQPSNSPTSLESQTVPFSIEVNPPPERISLVQPYQTSFQASADGVLTFLTIEGLSSSGGTPIQPELSISLTKKNDESETLRSSLAVGKSTDGKSIQLNLDTPLPVVGGEEYEMNLEFIPPGGAITLRGAGLANEGDWDDGLPLRIEGYDGFGGIYPQGLNFNMYWDDNPEKLQRFTRILNSADYIVISSSRQWGSLTRIPERFPMTTVYYRNLLGCPLNQSVENCYRIAQPGMYHGELGFDLIQVFESPPTIGPFRLNDQFAEEAFTVYDHPKVFIFKKTADYDPQKVRSILGSVDFSHVIRMPPMRFPMQPANLMLPEDRLVEQRQGGTWSELFNTLSPLNRSQPLAVVVWYLSIGLIGFITFPILRLALPGLDDHGYPLTRIAGLLILSYLVWLGGSARIPFSRLNITLALGLMLFTSILLALHQWKDLLQELRSRRNYFLLVEGLTLLFFITFLLIRLGNPDLWHPWKGGEKPMDFSYFNAVLKSTSFPPYDPWYSGGYINYYYYGFVLVGVLVKWLGIIPSIAYNLILPTLFCMIAMGAFSLAWNLSQKVHSPSTKQIDSASPPNPNSFSLRTFALAPALAAAFGMAVLGNLGTVRMIFQGYQKLIAPGGVIENAGLLTHWVWAGKGFLKALGGASLPYGTGDWYWNPSRAIPAPGDVEPITEFPFFTVLYGDPHAHLFALPLTLLALAFFIAIVLGKAHWRSRLGSALWFPLAALVAGSLRPTNIADYPPYLVLGAIAIGYSLWRYFRLPEQIHPALDFLNYLPEWSVRLIVSGGGVALFVALTSVLFSPFSQWYLFGYSKLELWKGTRTPLTSYLTHWGLFLFVISSWMAWEAHNWMAETPLSALKKLKPYRRLIQLAIFLITLSIIGLAVGLGVRIAWIALPLAALAGVLLLRPGIPDARRIVLFMVGTALVLTLMVEVIVVRGDIGRMNTVFKFYLQAWTLLSISAAVGLGWLISEAPEWPRLIRTLWQTVLIFLVAGACLYPLMAGMAKIQDRMTPNAPHTLDGMEFMKYATYTDEWGEMDLSYDYAAIRWLQEHVQGSPVIVEANLRNLYRWGSRMTVYTGLPGVVGWEWHQQQQRTVLPGSWVSSRIAEIDQFYLATDWKVAQDFLRKYGVRYIIVGQQEVGHYPGLGLEKFAQANGYLWSEVYRNDKTVIYEVIPQ